MNCIGNNELLILYKTAFLCSRQIPATTVLKCYDWAIEMREKKQCVISGFHSPLEKDVLDILLKGNQPIIIVLAKCLPKRMNNLFKGIDEKRLLIVSPFNYGVRRASTKTAYSRNQLMIDIADEITVGYASKNGQLDKLLSQSNKVINYLVP